MCDNWHIISLTEPNFPEDSQEIYCCIADDKSVSTVRRMKTDLKAFNDLLRLYPTWKILWKPLPVLPFPPSFSAISSCRKEFLHG